MSAKLKRIIRKRDVGPYLAGATRSTVEELMANDPDFPQLVPLTERIAGFVEDELAEWQSKKIAAARARK